MTKHLLVTLTLDERTRMMQTSDANLAEDLQTVVESFTETWSQGPIPAVHVQVLNAGDQVRIEP